MKKLIASCVLCLMTCSLFGQTVRGLPAGYGFVVAPTGTSLNSLLSAPCAQITNMLTAAAWAPAFTNSAMTDGVLTILPANGNLQILAPTGGTTLVTFGGATTNLFSMITLCVSNPSLYTVAWSNAIGNTAALPPGTNYHTFTFAAPYPGRAWSFMGGL